MTRDDDRGAIEDTARIKRLTEFATDAAQLADQRLDLDLRRLIDDLHRDLIDLEEDAMTEDLNPAEADRLMLLDRIAERIPWLDLDQQSIEWTSLRTATRRCS